MPTIARFREFNHGRAYADQVKPAKFLLLALDDSLVALPPGLDRQRLTLVAPFSSDPSAWLHLEYRNRFDGTVVPVTTRPDGLPGAVRIKTLWRRHRALPATSGGEECSSGNFPVL